MSYTPLSVDQLELYLENLPPILKYNNPKNNETNFEFSTFSELPFEVQEKILQNVPQYSRILGKNYYDSLTLSRNYYENYCLKTAISKRELIHYFKYIRPGSPTEFSYFLIGKNDENNIIILRETFEITRFPPQYYHIHNRYNIECDLKNMPCDIIDGTEEFIDYIFDGNNITEVYFFLPADTILKEILSQRNSCNILAQSNDEYYNKYFYLVVKEFLDFFASMPLVILKFSDNYLGLDIENDIITELSSLNMDDFVPITDNDSIESVKELNTQILNVIFEDQ